MADENPKSVISWPLDSTTQKSLRRWLDLEGSSTTRYVVWRVLDNLTFQATDTTQGGDFEIPFTGTLLAVGAYVDTAGVTGTCTVDMNLGGSTILSTKITIDTTEKSSRDATTPAVISSTAITEGDILTIDIDDVHSGTPAKGLTVVLKITT